MLLESEDPAKPLEIVLDKTWTGKDIQKQAQKGEWSNLVLGSFEIDATKGPVTLLIDYAAARPNSEDGEAIIDIGIECMLEDSGDGCPIPIADSVIGIRTALMGESVVKLNGAPAQRVVVAVGCVVILDGTFTITCVSADVTVVPQEPLTTTV